MATLNRSRIEYLPSILFRFTSTILTMQYSGILLQVLEIFVSGAVINMCKHVLEHVGTLLQS